MRKGISHITIFFSVLLSISIMLGITGLEMVYHKCTMSGSFDYAIGIPITQSTDVPIGNCSCFQQLTNGNECTNCHKDSHHEPIHKNCCNTGSDVYQLNLEYVVQQQNTVEEPKTIDTRLVFTSLNILLTNIIEDNTHDFSPESPPPPDHAGKFLVIAHNQLKIPSA